MRLGVLLDWVKGRDGGVGRGILTYRVDSMLESYWMINMICYDRLINIKVYI